MTNAGWGRVPAGAVMVGADGEAYLVPDRAEPAFRIPGPLGPKAVPGPGEVSADMRIRKGVQAALEYLPQMPNTTC